MQLVQTESILTIVHVRLAIQERTVKLVDIFLALTCFSFDPTKNSTFKFRLWVLSTEFSNEMLRHILLTFKISTNVNPVHAKMELHVSMVSLLTLVCALKDILTLIVEQVCYHIFLIAKIISLNRNWLFYKKFYIQQYSWSRYR